jgi:hypothetical protein
VWHVPLLTLPHARTVGDEASGLTCHTWARGAHGVSPLEGTDGSSDHAISHTEYSAAKRSVKMSPHVGKT